MNLDVDRVLFEKAARGAGATRDIGRAFELVSAAYQEPHRAYHTLTHIEHGIELLDTRKATLSQPDVVALAYWFHDVIYKTTPLANNESDSAKLLLSLGSDMGIAEPTLLRMKSMVLATKRHELPSGTVWNEDVDLETLLDVDLSILASDALTYARFERDVRTEYAWVPEALYVRGRKKALAHFLERASIYHRPDLGERWEGLARKNLSDTLRVLELDGASAHAVGVSDVGLFTTHKGRLERELRWTDVSTVVAEPLLAGGPRIKLVIGASEGALPFAEVMVGDPSHEHVIADIRRLQGYDVSREHEARTGHGRHVVFDATKTPYR